MEIPNIVVPQLVRLQQYPQCLALNSRREFYANPRALLDLESTVPRPWDWLVYEELDDWRFALHFIPKKIDGAVHVRRPKSGTTALFGAGPLLALSEWLIVARGRIREVPYTLEPREGGYPRFVITITTDENRPAKKRGKRSDK